MVKPIYEYQDSGSDDDWDNYDDDTADDMMMMTQKQDQDQFKAFSSGKQPYTMIESIRIRQIQYERVDELVEEMGVSQDLAFAMLVKNGWNIEWTKEAFGNDLDYVQKTFKFEVGQCSDMKKGEPFLCPVCYDEYEQKDVIVLEYCGHGLCTECYKHHLLAKISLGPECVHSICPDMKCNMIIPPRVFKSILTTKQYAQYKMHLVNSFVNISKQAKFCPGRNCDLICEQKAGKAIDINCTGCQESFCFGCTKEAHMPISCDLLMQWKDRIEGNDDDANNWIKINTKPCPKCKKPIEKNQGCMHMTCS